MKIPDSAHGQAVQLVQCGKDRTALQAPGSKMRRAGKRICARLRAGSEGQALIEMAFVLPIFLMVMLGIFVIGLGLLNQLTLTQATGTGAQYLQTIRTSTSDPCADTFTAIKNAAPVLNASNITVTIQINGVTPSQSGNSCTGAVSALQAAQGEPVTVTATYPCNLAVYNAPSPSGCTLSAMATEYEY